MISNRITSVAHWLLDFKNVSPPTPHPHPPPPPHTTHPHPPPHTTHHTHTQKKEWKKLNGKWKLTKKTLGVHLNSWVGFEPRIWAIEISAVSSQTWCPCETYIAIFGDSSTTLQLHMFSFLARLVEIKPDQHKIPIIQSGAFNGNFRLRHFYLILNVLETSPKGYVWIGWKQNQRNCKMGIGRTFGI